MKLNRRGILDMILLVTTAVLIFVVTLIAWQSTKTDETENNNEMASTQQVANENVQQLKSLEVPEWEITLNYDEANLKGLHYTYDEVNSDNDNIILYFGTDRLTELLKESGWNSTPIAIVKITEKRLNDDPSLSDVIVVQSADNMYIAPPPHNGPDIEDYFTVRSEELAKIVSAIKNSLNY